MTAAPTLVSARRHPAGFLEARARRGSGRRGRLLASFLQADLQGDAAAVRDLVAQIAAARRGEPPRPEAIGNAFAITVAPEGIELRNIILRDRSAEHYTLDELAAALAAWLAAIEQAPRGSNGRARRERGGATG